MARPLSQLSIAQLDAMFERNKAVRAELLLIETELRYRTTPRAKVLYSVVTRRLRHLATKNIERISDMAGKPGGGADSPQKPDPVDPKAAQWLRQALAKLREKLIDLSKRNPLVSFKHSERGASYLRIIDELPDQLFDSLREGDMTFEPLPAVETTPKDELTHEFRIAWERARLIDSIYLDEMEKLGEAVNDEAKVQAVERALRARVRAELGLPKISTGSTIDIAALARAHGFDPSFELAEEGEREGRHLTDNKIRVLLTADRLDARLRTIHDRYKGHAAETGLHTLYVALGFVEWFEDEASKITLHAPALILPVQLERKLERSRYVFSLSARDEDLQINMAMRELLKQRFNLEAPRMRENETPESYFIRLAGVLEEEPRLRLSLRRFATLAVLPFPRMVLWQDLDPEIWPEEYLDRHPLLPQLLGAKAAEGGGDFLSDYPIDDPEMASRVPPLVMNADVSQHSALIDVTEGRSLAIEGPPGTGKSQTITNMIAAALDRGKRVLFVAEKQAALDVVAKRLRDIGLGPLLLQLHSDRATKLELLREVAERLAARAPGNLSEIETLRTELCEKRDFLRRYLSLLHQRLGKLGRTTHKLVWRELALRQKCSDVPAVLQSRSLEAADQVDELQLKRAREALENVAEKAAEIIDRYGTIDRSPWHAARKLPAYDQDSALEAAKTALVESEQSVASIAEEEKRCGMALPRQEAKLLVLAAKMGEIPTPEGFGDLELHAALTEPEATDALLERWGSWQTTREAAQLLHDRPLDVSNDDLERLTAILPTVAGSAESLADARVKLQAVEKRLESLVQFEAGIQPILERFSLTRASPVQAIRTVCEAVLTVATVAPEISDLRSAYLLDDRSEAAICAARHEADELACRGAEAGKLLRLETALSYDPHKLASLIEVIAGAGFFARLFSGAYKTSWREAAKLFHQPPERETALEALGHLRGLIEDRRGFLETCRARVYFGEVAWRGVESDWPSLQAAQELLANIADSASAVGLEPAAEILAEERGRAVRRLAQCIEAAGQDVLADIPPGTTLDRQEAEARSQREHLASLVAAAEVVGLRPDAPLGQGTENCARTIAAYQEAHRALSGRPGTSEAWAWFEGPETQLEPLESARQYAKLLRFNNVSNDIMQALRESPGPVKSVVQMQKSGESLTRILGLLRASLESFCCFVDASEDEFFKVSLDETRTVETDLAALHTATLDQEGLKLHASLGVYLAEAEAEKCRFVYDDCVSRGVNLSVLPELYELLLVRSLVRQFLRADGATLERLGGLGLAQARARFSDIDDQLQTVEAHRIIADRLARDKAPEGVNSGPRGTWTELSLLRHQIGLQRRHIPIRDLIQRAGVALAALKPVWMMSPTSVAQYIKPGAARFDLVVIDEASQMRPEYAVGAVARGGQLVVVGDSNQLPPTDFFNVHVPDSLAELDDTEFEIDTESILDLANERLPHKRQLNWHYRSEHESLIQFSNRRFYQRRLVVFPSPTTDDPLLGIKHQLVKGIYEAQLNQPEAQAVIEEAMGIMLSRPELSMGIATMNIKQRDLIWAEFEQIAAQDRGVQSYIERHAGTIEPFFIKNLENVQGDERDVILISTVYGPDKDGHVFQRFGPLNSKVGHRRLNVLITRAKQTTRVFTSLRPDDIKATDGSNEGVLATQAYLRYAAGGATFDDAEGGQPDSDFEVFVADRLRGAGYEVVHQVGVEGFRIDLGVRHPSFPLGFIAGIECDGASFHSGLTVRDRDKIRQSILEKLGWKIYRIWSTDWFANAELETARLLAALNQWRDEAAATYSARRDSGEFATDSADACDIEQAELVEVTGREAVPEHEPEISKVLTSAVTAEPIPIETEGPTAPEGKHRQLDDIDWYETMRGTLFEVWPDGEYAGDIEVLSRGSSAPRLYGNTVAVHRSQYRGSVEATGETFVIDDLYAAVRRIAKTARFIRAPA